MVSKSVLLMHILLASATLAHPSSRLGARLARRRENRLSQLNYRVESTTEGDSDANYSVNWAGAIQSEDEVAFTTVTGTFTVPAPSGSDGAASAWVGIDGDTCRGAILQTGIDFTISNGEVAYDAWYEWYPDPSNYFSGITLSPGDVIRTTVNASSATSGTATIENLTRGKIVTKDLTSSHALCQKNAEWIVEDFEKNGGLVTFADFGSVTFSNAAASSKNGTTYTPSDATILDIRQNDQVLTSSNINGTSITVKYI